MELLRDVRAELLSLGGQAWGLKQAAAMELERLR
jgi:hypothetical protein